MLHKFDSVQHNGDDEKNESDSVLILYIFIFRLCFRGVYIRVFFIYIKKKNDNNSKHIIGMYSVRETIHTTVTRNNRIGKEKKSGHVFNAW